MSRSKITLIVIGTVLGIAILIVGGWAYRYYTAPIRGQIEQREEVQSGDYRLYSYEHFYNMYANIQAYEDQIRNQQEMLETVEGDEAARYRQNINALKNQRASAIREYNSDARKEESRGQFRSDDLPYQIDIE